MLIYAIRAVRRDFRLHLAELEQTLSEGEMAISVGCGDDGKPRAVLISDLINKEHWRIVEVYLGLTHGGIGATIATIIPYIGRTTRASAFGDTTGETSG